MKKLLSCGVALAFVSGFCASSVFSQETKASAPAVTAAPKAETAAVAALPLDPTTPIATVNDTKITVKDFQDLLRRIPPNYQSFVKNQKGRVINDMITQELIYQEANKKKLGEDKVVLESLENVKKQMMVQRYLQIEVAEKVSVTDKEVRDYFDAHKEEFNIPERVKASHILVKTKEEIDAALARLKKGEDFAKVAQDVSIDPSKVNGGDLGYFEKGRMIPEFENAVFALKPGETSDIVKTQFGFHVIKLTDRKPVEAKKFEDAEAEIKAKLLQEKQADAFNKEVEKLKNQSKVTVDEKLLEQLQ